MAPEAAWSSNAACGFSARVGASGACAISADRHPVRVSGVGCDTRPLRGPTHRRRRLRGPLGRKPFEGALSNPVASARVTALSSVAVAAVVSKAPACPRDDAKPAAMGPRVGWGGPCARYGSVGQSTTCAVAACGCPWPLHCCCGGWRAESLTRRCWRVWALSAPAIGRATFVVMHLERIRGQARSPPGAASAGPSLRARRDAKRSTQPRPCSARAIPCVLQAEKRQTGPAENAARRLPQATKDEQGPSGPMKKALFSCAWNLPLVWGGLANRGYGSSSHLGRFIVFAVCGLQSIRSPHGAPSCIFRTTRIQ